MKSVLLVVLISVFRYVDCCAQIDPFAEKEIIWFGVDFSAAKLIGSTGFTNIVEIKSKYLDGMNDIIVVENNKYNIPKYFAKNKVFNDLSVVQARNAAINTEGWVTDSDYSFGVEKVEEIIRSYKTEQNYGVGLVFIVESLNKIKSHSFVYVTFFDIQKKEVLFTKKVTGDPMGFTFKNYWTKSFLKVMTKSNWKMGKWQKEYKYRKLNG
jgi:hypothetical protein